MRRPLEWAGLSALVLFLVGSNSALPMAYRSLSGLNEYRRVGDGWPAARDELKQLLGDAAVVEFLQDANPQALAAMRARFAALHAAGLWQSRRNSIRAALEQTP